MKTTVTEYRDLASDGRGFSLPIGEPRLASKGLTAAGTTPALGIDTRYVRVATDTAIQIDFSGGTTGIDSEMLPANTVEFFKVRPGSILTIQLA